MDVIRSERLAGWLFIISMLTLLVSSVAAPSGVYQGSIPERLAIIDANQSRWILTKVLDSTTLMLVAVGGLALTINRRSWLRRVGGTLLMVAGAAGVVWFLLLAVSPQPLYDSRLPGVTILVVLMAVGLLGLSADFLRRGYPRWAGLMGVVLGVGILVGQSLIQILRLGAELAVAFEFLVLAGILSIGIMLVRQGASATIGSDAPAEQG